MLAFSLFVYQSAIVFTDLLSIAQEVGGEGSF
jgi:hypothetical protein